jgi:3-hydroxyisobutyrate dehydrogenase-like beta-hydroxyacid dehydrogenase
MSIRTVGILSPGDMGAATGRVLHDSGLDVVTCLDGRSELTRLRAREAGFRDVPDLETLVQQVDLLLSVLVPAEAPELAERVAAAFERTGARPVYADCNAIAPSTVARIAERITRTGATFIDAGIIGPPPRAGSSATRFHCSGPDTSALQALADHGLNVRVVGPAIGQASGLKMVYAASTKGTTALWTELLVAARALGLDTALATEFAESRADVAERIIGGIPSMPRRARRWVGEMEEIATTFADLGLTPRILQGAADMYRLVGDTPLADQTSRDPDPALSAVLETVRMALTPGPSPAGAGAGSTRSATVDFVSPSPAVTGEGAGG